MLIMVDIRKICQDLYDGTNYPGMWHGSAEWGKSADFHEHPFFIWEIIQQYLLAPNPAKKLNIVETGRCSGQSTVLFSGIAQETGGFFYSFDPADWGHDLISGFNNKYGIQSQYYNYVVDLSFNADKYLSPDFKIDVLFLDSLHTYECVKQETLIFEKYLSDKSIILFHDTVWCFDSVMGWVKDYLSDKDVKYVKHPLTHKPQCQYCETLWGRPNQLHGRPHMVNNRPDFQGLPEVQDSPHFEKLQYNFIKWSNEDFNQALEKHPMVFTNVENCCGVGALFIDKSLIA
jgi:hypothetical protein